MTERDDEAVSKFIERFALMLSEAGIPRMPARVFVGLLASDSGQLTAGELAELLSVSPAAVSGAVRYLTQVHLIVREREPGSKRDHYRVRGSSWYESAADRSRLLALWSDALTEGVTAVGPDTDAGARLRESVEFFEYLQVEIPLVLDRWRRSRNVAN
ncbi:GbsR/MarR family transcriptional regulator [Kutzneria kofuensis]|uniref:DNA-binding transcriptional ArsR family regulator n=1 Tax=Kutzneria kofuensis TaxID=103725 RepID=A0A7W9NGA7_9PSEU|nr:MarR family transcriptional regulator [Kutzneria kofuensis]MBB5891485.1 DNA-binding transcriptional ArsR family regulator [Kutzneria kofuensis]